MLLEVRKNVFIPLKGREGIGFHFAGAEKLPIQ
jgi:hypothetical protein